MQESENAGCNAECNASRISKRVRTHGTTESTVKATEDFDPPVRLEEEVRNNLDKYAEFIDANPSYVVSEALKLLFKKDDEFKRWAGQHANDHSQEQIKGEALTKTP